MPKGAAFDVELHDVKIKCTQTPQKKGTPVILVGTDLSHDERDSFRLSLLQDAPTREQQITSRDKWESIVAATRRKRTAAAGGEAAGGEADGAEADGAEAAVCDEAAGDEDVAADRPVTRGGAVPIERFSESQHSTFSDYELGRLGARHVRTRDVSYAEATQKLEEMGLQAEVWLHEVRRVCTQMDIVIVCLHVAFVVCASRCAVCVRGSQFSLPSGVASAFVVHDESICAHALV